MNIERQIIIGMITSTEFLKQIDPLIKIKWFKTEESKRIAKWCLDYFHKNKKAPNTSIQDIYFIEKEKLDNDTAGLIEDTLFSISEEQIEFDVGLYVKATVNHFKKTQIELLIEELELDKDEEDLINAQKRIKNFKPIEIIKQTGVTPLGTQKQTQAAYNDILQPLISYGETALGGIVNRLFSRQGFVGVMGQNKGGKTFHLMNFALKAAAQGNKIAFFQCGDMSQKQMERRIGIHLTKTSDLKEYCNKLYIPVLDCVYAQTGECNFDFCENKSDPPFTDVDIAALRWESDTIIPVTELHEAVNMFPGYKPCINCLRNNKIKNFKGTVWYKIRPKVAPLTWKKAFKVSKKRFNILKNINLITYNSDTNSEGLTMSKIKAEWDLMRKKGFTPDIGIIDYMEILEPDIDTKSMSLREQEMKKWQRGRQLSQEENALIIAATQSNAKGMDAKLLTRSNFSETKTKLDHVTGMIGLNMSKYEKQKGVMRINSIVDREGEGDRIVYVLHSLPTGQPILNSYW